MAKLHGACDTNTTSKTDWMTRIWIRPMHSPVKLVGLSGPRGLAPLVEKGMMTWNRLSVSS